MSGTKQGSAKAAATMKARYGEDYYRNIGRKGGCALNEFKGFGSHRDKVKEWGAKGGAISRRNKNEAKETEAE